MYDGGVIINYAIYVLCTMCTSNDERKNSRLDLRTQLLGENHSVPQSVQAQWTRAQKNGFVRMNVNIYFFVRMNVNIYHLSKIILLQKSPKGGIFINYVDTI